MQVSKESEKKRKRMRRGNNYLDFQASSTDLNHSWYQAWKKHACKAKWKEWVAIYQDINPECGLCITTERECVYESEHYIMTKKRRIMWWYEIADSYMYDVNRNECCLFKCDDAAQKSFKGDEWDWFWVYVSLQYLCVCIHNQWA